MSRLIDADALERAVMFLGEDSICNDCAYEFVSLIDEQPTIEAEPVMRGEWEMAIGYDPKRAFMCDQCHKMAFEPALYCPNCGAKMEVEE